MLQKLKNTWKASKVINNYHYNRANKYKESKEVFANIDDDETRFHLMAYVANELLNNLKNGMAHIEFMSDFREEIRLSKYDKFK